MSARQAQGRRLRVAVLFGGRSGEHEISLTSAANIMAALSPDRYEVVPIGIDRAGHWLASSGALDLLRASEPFDARGSARGLEVLWEADQPVDVVFPVLHGTYGEDGSVQGLLEMAGLAYVGCGVLASALAMDKIMCKRVLVEQHLPTPEYTWFRAADWSAGTRGAVEAICGYPCFVKPANLGSSVGISKVKGPEDLDAAVRLAGRYDVKVLVERAVPAAREIECAVLGNDRPEASVPGEIVPSGEFYDYAAKYVDASSELLIPAPLTEDLCRRVRDLATKAFLALDCSGMARVDFLLAAGSGELYLNEVNTIPGFTAISMYPKLWAASGRSTEELVDRLIELALERRRRRSRLSTTLS